MQQTVIKGSVSRIHLRPFGGPTSFIRVEFKTLEFIESALTRSVLAMTEKGDHVELTFEAMGEFDPLQLVHIRNSTLEESAGHGA
jgi:hypothetical protein